MIFLVQRLIVAVFAVLALALAGCAHVQAPSSTGEPADLAAAAPGEVATAEALADDPDAFLDTDLRAILKEAQEAYEGKDYARATALHRKYLSNHIGNGGVIYNLACLYGLQADPVRSAKTLERAVAAGFDELSFVHEDKDFDLVREDPVFKNTLAELEQAHADRWAKMGETVLIPAESYLQAYVQKPKNWETLPAGQRILIIGLHGFGDTAPRFAKLWERFDNPNFAFASLSAPYAFNSGGELGESWTLMMEEQVQPASLAYSLNYVERAAEVLEEKYQAGQVYLLGFSQGCFMAYLAGIKAHEQFDGVIACGGWLEPEMITDDELKRANHLRVYIIHGDEDSLVAPQEAAAARTTLEAAGFNVTARSFAGGHRIPDEVLPSVNEWLMGKPEPAPAAIADSHAADV